MAFARYRQIFQSRPFSWFWSGFTFSALGDAMTRVALTWFVWETTHSATALGWLMLCYTGPILVGGFVAGPLLDRFDRRRVMIADSLVRGVAVASVPLLNAAGLLALWHVYLVAAVYGALMMISLAGGPSLIPSIVRREQLATANALETLSFTLAGVVGPVAAGLLIGWIGAPNVVIADALSYFTFAFALVRARPAEETGPTRPAGAPPYGMKDAVRLLLTNPMLFATTFMFMAYNIGGGILSVWLPILSDQTLGGGAELYGGLLGALALGEVSSALLVGGGAFALGLGTLICMAQTLSGASLVIVLAGRSAAVAAVGLFFFGAFSAPLTIWAQTLRMQVIPAELRGRTFALLRTLMQGGNPIGGALGGLLLPVLGVPAMVLLSALVIGAPGMLGYQVKGLREAGRPVVGEVVH
ncbi:MAG: MFS transporter [Chloroflexi bacterium]|nr:MFS transporter [Chloroflexota bacterium]